MSYNVNCHLHVCLVQCSPEMLSKCLTSEELLQKYMTFLEFREIALSQLQIEIFLFYKYSQFLIFKTLVGVPKTENFTKQKVCIKKYQIQLIFMNRPKASFFLRIGNLSLCTLILTVYKMNF